ncbi:MAG TPA: hypothetical protein VMT79_09350 [Candidatus Binatia bacterium]|nr:hypothetical protein [Candidatus Binatia bacterium]
MTRGTMIRASDSLAVDDDPEIGGPLRVFLGEHRVPRGAERAEDCTWRAPSVEPLASAV